MLEVKVAYHQTSYENKTTSCTYKSHNITCCMSFGAYKLILLQSHTTYSNLSMHKPKSVGDSGDLCLTPMQFQAYTWVLWMITLSMRKYTAFGWAWSKEIVHVSHMVQWLRSPYGCSSVGKVAQWRPGGHGFTLTSSECMKSVIERWENWVSNPRRSGCQCNNLPLW